MTNPNAPYAAQPQQSGFQPQPQFQPQQPYVPRPVAPLRTQRGLLKYVLLGLVTFSIYDIWQMSEVGDSLNLLAFKRDGKHTMHYCLMFFLVGWVTLGIGWLVWYHRVSGRIGEEQAARGLDQYRQQFRRGQRATVAVDVGQRVAGHVLHDEEADAIVLVILEQRGDVGVRQIGGIVRFRPQTVQLGLDVALIVAQRLDGDGTVELDVVAFPHLSHAALRQSAIQAVTAVDELSFDEFHCFRASSISERMIGPAASTPY